MHGARLHLAILFAFASIAAGVACGSADSSGTPPNQSIAIDTVFAEGFESGTFAAWDDRGLAQNQSIVTTDHHGGTHALQVTFPSGSDGGWLTKFFLPGYDSIYASYWVKLQSGWLSGTKMLSFFGSRTDNQWSATGTAGKCPNGHDFFILDVVQERTATPGGPTHFYAQYPAMPHTPPGSATCFGHDGISAGAVYSGTPVISPGAWHYVEFWAVINTLGQSNARQGFCVDGVARGTWSGISVRDSAVLKLNALTISNSIANGSPQAQQMWVDDVLVTRQRPPGSC
jgi:hypothetical protein